MENRDLYKFETVGVIGAGTFGTTIAMLLAENVDVLIYSRRKETLKKINEDHFFQGVKLPERIVATDDMQKVAEDCDLIFPIVPSAQFRNMMQSLSPFLKPHHILIHGTKGLDITESAVGKVSSKICTMSDVILEESVVVRVGCLSGPNLAREMLAGQPAATVIGSSFKEVIKAGQTVLRSTRFQVFSNDDLKGAELAGALKNTIAIGSGMLGGLGLGYNIWALLVTRGSQEMIHFGKALGAEIAPFLGIAGIGDLIATASSPNSRNYTVGYRMAKGETLEGILATMEEPAEGVRTIKAVMQLANEMNFVAPITQTIYKILYEGLEIQKAIEFLMNYRYTIDVDYL